MATGFRSGESDLQVESYVAGTRIVWGSKGSTRIDTSGAVTGDWIVEVAYGGSFGAGINVETILGTNNQASGTNLTNALVAFTPVVNQSGTAGYDALQVNVTETATGSGTKNLLDLAVAGVTKYSISNAGFVTTVGGVATAGVGSPVIVAAGRQIAQVAADASVATYTVGAADASFQVVANVNVTTATTYSFTVTCTYTDETNTSRVLTMTFTIAAGTQKTTLANTDATFVYMGIVQSIRCKAATTITIASAAGGTYTTVAYNIEGFITKMS